MIWLGIGVTLCAYQVFSLTTRRPPVSALAHRMPWALFIWAYWFGLAAHFILEAKLDLCRKRP